MNESETYARRRILDENPELLKSLSPEEAGEWKDPKPFGSALGGRQLLGLDHPGLSLGGRSGRGTGQDRSIEESDSHRCFDRRRPADLVPHHKIPPAAGIRLRHRRTPCGQKAWSAAGLVVEGDGLPHSAGGKAGGHHEANRLAHLPCFMPTAKMSKSCRSCCGMARPKLRWTSMPRQ